MGHSIVRTRLEGPGLTKEQVSAQETETVELHCGMPNMKAIVKLSNCYVSTESRNNKLLPTIPYGPRRPGGGLSERPGAVALECRWLFQREA